MPIDHIIKTLGFLAHESPYSRDIILQQKGLERVLEVVTNNGCPVQRALKTIGSFLGGVPPPTLRPSLEVIKFVFDCLNSTSASENQLLKTTFEAIEIICDTPEGARQLIELKIGNRLIDLLADPAVSEDSMDILLNVMIWVGEDPCFEDFEMIKERVFPRLFGLAQQTNRQLARQAIKVISNICCGPAEMVMVKLKVGNPRIREP